MTIQKHFVRLKRKTGKQKFYLVITYVLLADDSDGLSKGTTVSIVIQNKGMLDLAGSNKRTDKNKN